MDVLPKRVTILGSPMEADPDLPVVTISPAVVDVTQADAIVRISSNGLPAANYFSLSPHTGPPMEVAVNHDRSAQISRDIVIPKGTPPGRWSLGVRHETFTWWVFGAPYYGPVRHTLPPGYPSGIEILNSGPMDQDPPQVSDLVIDPAVVDVTTGPALARLRFRLQDQGTGVFQRNEVLGSVVTVWNRKREVALTNWERESPQLVSGNLQDGVWEVSLTIPQLTDPGPVTLDLTMGLQDRAGNLRSLSTRGADFEWGVVPEPMPPGLLPSLTVMAPGPDHDLAANARVLPGTLPATGTGRLAWARVDRPDLPLLEAEDSPEVWHRWIAPSDGLVSVAAKTLNTYGYFNLLSAVYDGLPTATNLLTRRGLWRAESGREYWIALTAPDWASFDSPEGSAYELEISQIEPIPLGLESLDVSPRQVDITEAGGMVTVTGTARLEPGWRCLKVEVILTDEPHFADPEIVTVIPVALPDGRFSYTADLPISEWAKAGPRNVSLLFGMAAGDSLAVSTTIAFSSPPGYPFPVSLSPAFEIVNRSPVDQSGPLLLRFTRMSPPPNVKSAPGEAVFEMDVWDDRSGFDPSLSGATGLVLNHSLGYFISPDVTVTRLSGDALSGTWQLRIPLEQGLPSGLWSIALKLQDRAQNISWHYSGGRPFSEILMDLPISGIEGYEAWRLSPRNVFLSNPGEPYGPVTGDDNGNGVPNLLAYAFDLNRWNEQKLRVLSPANGYPSPTGLPEITIQPGPVPRLQIRFVRLRDDPASRRTGLTYRPQFSSDPAGPWIDALPATLVIESQGEVADIVSVTDPSPGGKSRYARVLVEYRHPD